MSTKKLILGIMAGFSAGTIAGIMLTSAKTVKVRNKLLAQSEAYLGVAANKFIDHLSDLSKQFDNKIEKQVHADKHEKVLNKTST